MPGAHKQSKTSHLILPLGIAVSFHACRHVLRRTRQTNDCTYWISESDVDHPTSTFRWTACTNRSLVILGLRSVRNSRTRSQLNISSANLLLLTALLCAAGLVYFQKLWPVPLHAKTGRCLNMIWTWTALYQNFQI